MINHNDIQYKVLTKPSQEIIDLLSNTVYGTKGLRYSHQNLEDRIFDLINPHFHTLWFNDQLLAVAAYCHREIELLNQPLPTIYIRYFAVNKNFQEQGLGKLLTQKLYSYYEKEIDKPTIFYAYIEKKNIRSLGVSKRFEQKEVGQFKTIYFSRFFPKKSKRVTSVSNSEIDLLYKNHFSNYAFSNPYKLNYKEGYRVVKKGEEIVAGIQANKANWTIHNLPGFMGWLTRNVLHYLPIIGRLSPKYRLSFIGFEGIFYKKGHLNDLIELMEHCLAEQKVYSGIIPLCMQDPKFKEVSSHSKLGLMNKIQAAHPVSVLVNYHHTTPETEANIETLPKYLSVFDLT